jgi:hypothetical protein
VISRSYRWAWPFHVAEKVTCPAGHPFSIQEIWGIEDCLYCDHKGRDGREDCGRRVYLMPMLRYRAKPILFAIEVSAREMEELKNKKTADDILDFLFSKDHKAA